MFSITLLFYKILNTTDIVIIKLLSEYSEGNLSLCIQIQLKCDYIKEVSLLKSLLVISSNYPKLIFRRFIVFTSFCKIQKSYCFFEKNRLFGCFLSIILIAFLSFPKLAEAHAYSASYTKITMDQQ